MLSGMIAEIAQGKYARQPEKQVIPNASQWIT